jgi:hypothetical protein
VMRGMRTPGTSGGTDASKRPDRRGAPHRLGRLGRCWRLVATALVLAGLFYGSAWGGDDDFPLGPMTQFAFYVASDGGEIHSHWLEADTTAGTHVKVSMDAVGVGLKRAEVEGQLGRFLRDPSLLQGVADAQRRLHPGQPAYTRIHLVQRVQTLRRGRVVATATHDRVTWTVR